MDSPYVASRTHATRRIRYLACWALIALLVFGAPPFAPSWAVADEADDEVAQAQKDVDDAHLNLSDAEARMQGIATECDDLQKEIDDLQKRLDEASIQAKEAQQAVIEGRSALGRAARYEYRGGAPQSLMVLLLESTSFDEFMRNMSYFSSIMQYQSEVISEQKERSDQFEATLEDLNTQKDAQDHKRAELEEKKTEAEKLIADANAQVQNAQDSQAARIAALKEKADALAAQNAVSAPVADPHANTIDRPDPPQTTPIPDPDLSDSDKGWSSGVASAYGGSTDPYTPNPGITATGAVCNDSSMGVAVPMSWPRYWQYYGRTVEIAYNGITVLATINDCGYMGGGSRSLDLQPGVWKAFGFTSCTDWGLRTVSYRIL